MRLIDPAMDFPFAGLLSRLQCMTSSQLNTETPHWNWMLTIALSLIKQWYSLFGTAQLLACLILLFVGCDNSGRVQVSGKVEFLDGSVPTGEVAMIRFEPSSYEKSSKEIIRKGAYGYIQPDGSFRMTTLKPEDGVYPGTYKVCFTVMKTYGGGESLIPSKYTSKESTPFEETIVDGVDDLHFQLETLNAN